MLRLLVNLSYHSMIVIDHSIDFHLQAVDLLMNQSVNEKKTEDYLFDIINVLQYYEINARF